MKIQEMAYSILKEIRSHLQRNKIFLKMYERPLPMIPFYVTSFYQSNSILKEHRNLIEKGGQARLRSILFRTLKSDSPASMRAEMKSSLLSGFLYDQRIGMRG